jgi:hypothetical protein
LCFAHADWIGLAGVGEAVAQASRFDGEAAGPPGKRATGGRLAGLPGSRAERGPGHRQPAAGWPGTQAVGPGEAAERKGKKRWDMNILHVAPIVTVACDMLANF